MKLINGIVPENVYKMLEANSEVSLFSTSTRTSTNLEGVAGDGVDEFCKRMYLVCSDRKERVSATFNGVTIIMEWNI